MRKVIADRIAWGQLDECPLTLADLEREIRRIPLEVTTLSDAQVLTHDLFTNGIVYLDLALDLRPLPAELLPYVPLFGRALTQMGTAAEDFVRLSQRIGQTTGGLYATTLVAPVRGGVRGGPRGLCHAQHFHAASIYKTPPLRKQQAPFSRGRAGPGQSRELPATAGWPVYGYLDRFRRDARRICPGAPAPRVGITAFKEPR